MAASIVPPSWVFAHPLVEPTYRIVAAYSANLDASPEKASEELIALYTPSLQDFSMLFDTGFLWATILHAASQIDPLSPLHSHLTDLFLAIRKHPPPQETPAIAQFKDIRKIDSFWSTLPLLPAVWKDFDIAAPLHPRLMNREYYANDNRRGPRPTTSHPGPWRNESLTSAQWASLNAVLAKEHARTNIVHLDLKGLFALIDALEYKHGAGALDDLVPAAAVWVIFAGRKVKFNDVGYPPSGDDMGSGRLPWSAGPLWGGKKGFSDERWGLWKERFRTVSLSDGVERGTKEWAERAWEAMRKVDDG